MKMIKPLPLTIFILGALSLAVGYSIRRYQPQQLGQGFTVHYQQTFTSRDGSAVNALDGETVRYVRRDTSWKEVVTYYNHQDKNDTVTQKQFSTNERGGTFRIDDKNKSLVFLGPRLHTIHGFEVAEAKQDASFVREDNILGYTVIVSRTTEPNGDYAEFWRSPELGGTYLKSIFSNQMGVNTIEAVKILAGDPPEVEFAQIPNYPEDYDFYRAKINAEEKKGNTAEADLMRQVLAQRQQSQ